MESTNISINSSVIESIIEFMHIFNNIYLASKLCIIKISLKSDMVIIWIDIWNFQSGIKAKGLINKYFNVGNYITTIQRANMNPSVL